MLLPGLPINHAAEVRGFNEGYRCEHWLMGVDKAGGKLFPLLLSPPDFYFALPD